MGKTVKYGQKFILKHVYSGYYLSVLRQQLGSEFMSFQLIINETDSLSSIFSFQPTVPKNMYSDLVLSNQQLLIRSEYDSTLFLKVDTHSNNNVIMSQLHSQLITLKFFKEYLITPTPNLTHSSPLTPHQVSPPCPPPCQVCSCGCWKRAC